MRYLLILLLIVVLSNNAMAQHTSLDDQTLIELMEHRGHEHTELEQFLSNSTNYLSLAIPLSILAHGTIRGDKITLQKGLYIGESIVVSSLITYALKTTINRDRPFKRNSFIIPEGAAGSPSFPSGHTSQAFSTATSLSIAFPKWYVIAPAFTWASAVGYSRMYLGVHYPSDVIGGAIVGAGSAWLTYKANQWLQGKHKHHTIATY